MDNCKTYIPTPQITDICGGEIKDAKCVIDENAYIDLGIEADSNQGDINQAVYNALQASKTTTDELQLQIDDVDGSETKVTQGSNVTITGTGTTLNPYIVNGLLPPFEGVDEGSGLGYIIRGRDPLNYGPIGEDAFDISWSGGPSSTIGATGINSFAQGYEMTISGNAASGFGELVTLNGDLSFGTGRGHSEAGYGNFLTGGFHIITGGAYASVVGQFANSITNNILNVNDGTNTMFAVGNGTADESGSPQTRSTAFQVFQSGEITIPKYGDGTVTGTATYALQVDTNGKIIEGALDTRPYKVYTALISQSGTSAPTLVVLENTLGDTITSLYNGVGNYTFQLATLNLFVSSKTFILLNSSYNSNAYLGIVRGDDSQLLVSSAFNGSDSNNILVNASLEIRVYN